MLILVIAAIIPVALLCLFIYKKDKNKEPKGLLAGIFLLGFVAVFPVLICELIFGAIFPMNTDNGFLLIFLNVLFGVALYEESFKWLITKFLGYKNKEFDEVYDIIVYSVFSSLGFACFENICYVLQNGLGNALLRALLAIPGHTCFAIAMGYFFSRAKVNEINGNKALYSRNIVLSIVVPILLHTGYDSLLFNVGDVETLGSLVIGMLPFILFYSGMVIACFITVDKTAKIQQNLVNNLKSGAIARDNQGYLYYTYSNPGVPTMGVSTTAVAETTTANTVSTPIVEEDPLKNVPVMIQTVETVESTTPAVAKPDEIEVLSEEKTMVNMPPVTERKQLNYCPICAKPSEGKNFCSHCGFRFL